MEKKISLIGNFATDWFRYSEYDFRANPDNEEELYICPKEGATYSMYNPFDIAEQLLLDILDIGDMSLEYKKSKDEEIFGKIKRDVLIFAKKYGLPGFMACSVYNRDILGDKTVMLVKGNNLMIKEKFMNESEYMYLFTPFAEEEDVVVNHYRNSVDVVKAEDSPKYYGKRPVVIDLMFSKFYCEKLEWFLNFAQMLSMHFNQLMSFANMNGYLTEKVTIMPESFNANKIGFTIEKFDRATISWQFDSLKTAIETIYAFAVTDENVILNRCVHCSDFFFPGSSREKYCSPVCRNRENVKRSRMRSKEKELQRQSKEKGEKTMKEMRNKSEVN